jgi:hypothetical protein
MIRPEGRGSLIETNSQMYRLADLYHRQLSDVHEQRHLRSPPIQIQRQSSRSHHAAGSLAQMRMRCLHGEPLGDD